MIADEVQCGIGRTGYLKAVDYEQIKPDVLIMAKPISAGFYPVSVVMADSSVMDVWSPGMHGSTFSSNPLACTAVMSALDVLEEENLAQNSRVSGKYMLDSIKDVNVKFLSDVRGRGLFIAMDTDPSSKV